MNAHIRELSDEQWRRPFGGYFKSVKSLCNHVWLGDYNWLKRFSALRPFEWAKDPFFDRDLPFSSRVLEGIESYLELRSSLDLKLASFASEVAEEDFSKTLSYVDSRGSPHARNFGGLILHCFNHQTHHRGMVSLYLELLGIGNDFNNLTEVLPDAAGKAI